MGVYLVIFCFELDPELPFDLELDLLLDPLLGLELPLRRLDPLLELLRLDAASHNSTVTRTMERTKTNVAIRMVSFDK